ncbi:hypothetical protein [Nostoc sp.]|uniref:hypothetical protein n=1 Tax=Nostoc sp. TaxID=1180 RepID=UPI002FFC441D
MNTNIVNTGSPDVNAPNPSIDPSLKPDRPNLFELQDKDTQITYSASSFTGIPQLNYKERNISRNFSGEEIDTLETQIGKLLTVLIEPNADTGKSIYLTLLLPTINLPAKDRQNLIQTEAILTTQREVPFSPDRPPFVEGQIQTYKTLLLKGTASRVEF